MNKIYNNKKIVWKCKMQEIIFIVKKNKNIKHNMKLF